MKLWKIEKRSVREGKSILKVLLRNSRTSLSCIEVNKLNRWCGHFLCIWKLLPSSPSLYFYNERRILTIWLGNTYFFLGMISLPIAFNNYHWCDSIWIHGSISTVSYIAIFLFLSVPVYLLFRIIPTTNTRQLGIWIQFHVCFLSMYKYRETEYRLCKFKSMK